MKLEDLIRYHSESSTLDFKKEQYPIESHPKKHELLKDISAMANNPDNSEKYIIIGIKEEGGLYSSSHPIADLVDEAKYRQYINSNIEPEIHFEYKPVEFEGQKLAFFRIFGNQNRPYLVRKDVKHENKIELREGDGFIRVGTSTRRINRGDLDRIYESKHVGIDRAADLKIECYSVQSNVEASAFYNPYCLEIAITNTSNKSIDFQVQIIVPKQPNISRLIKAHDVINSHRKSKRNNGIFGMMGNGRIPSNLEDKEDFSDVDLTLRNDHYIIDCDDTISIAQQQTISEVLNNEILVECANSHLGETTVNGTVIIRSDSFTSGPLTHPFSLTIPMEDDW